VQKFSRIKVYNMPALATLLFGSEIITLRKGFNHLASFEIKFFIRTVYYTLTTKGMMKFLKS
jgi:hypothetical protein